MGQTKTDSLPVVDCSSMIFKALILHCGYVLKKGLRLPKLFLHRGNEFYNGAGPKKVQRSVGEVFYLCRKGYKMHHPIPVERETTKTED